MKVCMRVVKVEGECAAGYEPGDEICFEGFRLVSFTKPVCLHLLASALHVVYAMLKGINPEEMGYVGGLLRCPDPVRGSVTVKLERR